MNLTVATARTSHRRSRARRIALRRSLLDELHPRQGERLDGRQSAHCIGRAASAGRRGSNSHLAPASVQSSSHGAAIAFHATRYRATPVPRSPAVTPASHPIATAGLAFEPAAGSASLRQRRLLELRPMASSRESTSCLCIGCDGFGRVALLLVVHADSRAPARQQRVRRAPRRPHGGTAGWTPRVPEDGRGMPRACPGWW
jgi:hypothetical protein